MHLSELLQPALGFLGMLLSFIVAQVSEAIPEAARGWVEGGAYVALVGFLAYTSWTFWKRLNDRDQEIADLNREIRDDWKEQNEKLITVLDKLDKNP
jgi:hypothetical protein